MTRFRVLMIGAGIVTACVALAAVWLPARATGGRIPAGATAVTLSERPGLNAHAKPPAAVTVTGQATVGKLVALVDGLPPFPAGAYHCPMDDESGLVLTFTAGPAGKVLAVATVALTGCEGVDLTIGGKQQPGLGAPDGGRPDAAQALKIAGLRWSLPS